MPRPAAVAAVPLTAADGTSTSTPAAGPAVCRARRRQNSSVDTGTPCLRQKTRKLSSLRSKRSSHLARSFVLHRRCLRMAAFSEIPVDPHRALLPPNKSRLEELSVHWAPECGLALGGDLQCCWDMPANRRQSGSLHPLGAAQTRRGHQPHRRRSAATRLRAPVRRVRHAALTVTLVLIERAMKQSRNASS